MTLISTYPNLSAIAAMDNTNLISDEQWRALGLMSLRSGRTIQQLLEHFYVEPVDAERSDAVYLMGRVYCGPDYHLAGCIDPSGRTHT